MARSGLAAASALKNLGADVTLYDGASAEKLKAALDWAASRNIPTVSGSDVVGDVELLVTSPGVRATARVLVDAVERGIRVWGEIEAAFRISKAPILAITGSNGKTTTTALLGEMVNASGVKAYVAGNIAAGGISMPLISAAADASEDEVIVAEISSFQLEWTPSFAPRAAVILNITPDHLDRPTWDEYVAAKWNIFAHQTKDALSLVRSDTPVPDGWKPNGAAPVCYDRLDRPLWADRLLIPGEHNVQNAIAAACMAAHIGVDAAAMERAATSFGGVVHRMEFVAEKRGVRFVNN